MKFKIRFAQQIVGIFVLVAAVSIVGVVVSMAANQRWFARDYAFYSVFPTAEGLSVGMSISFKGFEIGRITEITLADRDEVRVDFLIQDTYYDKVVPNSILELVQSPIGLGGGLVFHQGRSNGPPLEEGNLIPAINSKEGQAIVDADDVFLASSGDSITRIIGQVEPLLRNVNTVLISVEQALSGDQNEPLAVTIGRINTLLAEVETTLVETRTTILRDVAGITANLEETSEAFRDPTGIVPRLIDADGSIATFLDDDNRLYDEIEQMLVTINATLDEVNDLADFVNGTQPQIAGIMEEGREAITTGQDVLEGLSNNPLIRGGITQELSQQTTFESYRDGQF
ncbi:MAG: MlaD family protein [Spirochaetales bacterium]|nr:MlaD family protein [Spirochaetales bacterium]